jgi:hypothetical protein
MNITYKDFDTLGQIDDWLNKLFDPRVYGVQDVKESIVSIETRSRQINVVEGYGEYSAYYRVGHWKK